MKFYKEEKIKLLITIKKKIFPTRISKRIVNERFAAVYKLGLKAKATVVC